MRDSEAIAELQKDAARAASLIRKKGDVLIVAHIDADGISSAAIAAKTCERLNKDYEVLFANKMDEATIEVINTSKRSLVWIVDLGSGYLSKYTRDNIVITDHHVPDPNWRKQKQVTLDRYCMSMEHVNCHNQGLNGSVDACGASTTYLVSKAVDPSNMDLAYIAVIGACGDIQDYTYSKLVCVNELALMDAVMNGDITVEHDLRLFGRETRPLVQFIQYNTDPMIEGLSDNSAECNRFFASLDIPLRDENGNRSWNSLSQLEKERARDALIQRVDPDDVDVLIGDVYTLNRFPHEGGLRDVKEFATTLNSCGRYDDAPTGMRICLGDPDAMKDADDNRAEHKRNISAALQYVRQNDLVKTRKYIQYFNAGRSIKDTVVGIVTGMLLNSDGYRKDLPMIAFAAADDGIKVSARADRSLAQRGLDLSIVMNTAAGLVGGFGGGHNVAAGATIPPGKEDEFLDAVEDIIASQII